MRVDDALGGEDDPDALQLAGLRHRGPRDRAARDHRHRPRPGHGPRHRSGVRRGAAARWSPTWRPPRASEDALIKASIVDNAQERDVPGLPAAGPQPRPGRWCWACCSASGRGGRARAAGHLGELRRRRRHRDRRADPRQHLHRRPPLAAPRPRSWPTPARGPRRSGCCAPTCSTSQVDHDQKVFVVTSVAAGRGQDDHGRQPGDHPRPGQPPGRARRVRPAPSADRPPAGLDGAVGTTSVLIGKVNLDDGAADLPRHRPPGPRLRADPAQPVRAAAVGRDGEAAGRARARASTS